VHAPAIDKDLKRVAQLGGTALVTGMVYWVMVMAFSG
jgi:hypothetical protein